MTEPARLTMSRIVDTVCEDMNVTRAQLLHLDRDADLIYARRMTGFLCRRLTSNSYPQIGRYLRRHHACIMDYERQIDRLMVSKPGVAQRVAHLTELLTAAPTEQ